MLEAEIGKSGMDTVVEFLNHEGFDLYYLHGENIEGQTHKAIANDGTVTITPKMKKRGFILYGENPMKNLNLRPACVCGSSKKQNEPETFHSRHQHVFVRRGTPVHDVVTLQYGSCPLCLTPGAAPQTSNGF